MSVQPDAAPSAAVVHRLVGALADQPGVTRKTCPACGAAFPCLPGACWCSAISLTPAQLASLRGKYDNCLCPGCLLSVRE